jgi:hypothetical protein
MLEEVNSSENISAPPPSPCSSPETLHQTCLVENINTPVEILEQTVVELVKKYLEVDVDEAKNEIGIQITPEIIRVINNIISLTPNTLTDIEKAIVEIVKDGRIDSKDIPNLIVVVQIIYQTIYNLKNVKFDAKKRADITSTSLKYLVHILVLEKKIKIHEDNQSEFLAQTDALIDSCISLLSFSKSLKTKGCFKKLF